MEHSELLWQGKSKKSYFHIHDFWGIVVGLCALGLGLFIFKEWSGKIEGYVIGSYHMFIAFHEILGKFIIRNYYVKHVHYELYSDRLVIKLKVFGWNYIREFNIKDISPIYLKKYKTGLGSIHFGETEVVGLRTMSGQLNVIEENIRVSTHGLLFPKNKWNSGIIYSIDQAEKVYGLLAILR